VGRTIDARDDELVVVRLNNDVPSEDFIRIEPANS
jgi:hypothetical protein